MAMTGSQWNKFYGATVYNNIKSGYEMVKPLDGIFDEKTTKLYQENDTNIITFGPFGEWSGEGVKYPTDVADTGYDTSYIQAYYALAFAVTYKMKVFEQYNIVDKMSKALGFSARYTIELNKANIINTAFSKLWGDGKALIATDHPVWMGGEQSNKLGTDADLSHAALSAGLRYFNGVKDARGNFIHMVPKVLILHTDYEETVDILLKSSGLTGTADNDINWLATKDVKPTYSPLFTDDDAWLLACDKKQNEAYIYWKEKPNFGHFTDEFTENEVYKGKFAMALGLSDWRGWYGSPGA